MKFNAMAEALIKARMVEPSEPTTNTVRLVFEQAKANAEATHGPIGAAVIARNVVQARKARRGDGGK